MWKYIFLLVNVVRFSKAVDNFKFEVELTCGYHQREGFNYNVQFFEIDSFLSGNDPITSQKIGEARPGTAFFTMEGSQDGDEVGSSAYDVAMVVYHDCTEYIKETKLVLNVTPRCKYGKGICHYTIKKDIKDANGEMGYQAHLVYE